VEKLRQKTVFVLGDSISVHYGPYLKRMLQGAFLYDRQREAGQTLEDLDNPVGANAGDSRQVLKFLRKQSKRRVHYDILLLNCGLHDLRTDPQTQGKQVPAEEYRQNLQSLLRLAKEMCVSTVWVRTTPVDDERHNSRDVGFNRYDRDVVHYNEVADAVMKENQVPVIDLYSFTRNLGNDVYCDHVHFKEEVTALQAAFVAGHLYRLNSEAA
jgi:lysophospholipase L1-like esterase